MKMNVGNSPSNSILFFSAHFFSLKKKKKHMLPNLTGIMLWVGTISQPLSGRWGARFVNYEGILEGDKGILVADEGIFTKFSATTKEFL